MEKEDELKEELYKKLKLTETQIPSVRNRIHIPVSYNIFDVKNQNDEKELATVWKYTLGGHYYDQLWFFNKGQAIW